MDAATKGELEADRLTSWFRASGITGPWLCLQCKGGIRKARFLKAQDGRRYATLSFCSQDCHDRYLAQYKLPVVRWEKYSQDGILLGYVVPRKGFISLEEIEEAELSSDRTEEDQGAGE